jgi:hypothetical protein
VLVDHRDHEDRSGRPASAGVGLGLNEAAGYLAVAVTAYLTGLIAARAGLRPEPFYLGLAYAGLGLGLSALLVREARGHADLEAQLTDAEQPTGHNSTPNQPPAAARPDQLSTGQVGLLAALYPAVWGLGQLLTGPMSDRLGRKPLITGGMLLQATALAGTAVAGNFLPWAATAILLGAGTAMVYPTLLAAISDVAHPTWRATAVGVYRLWRIPASPWAPCSPAWWPTSPAWRPPSGWLPPSPPPPAWSWPGACTRPTDRHGSPDSAAAVSDLSGPQHAARPPVPGRPDRPAAAPRSWWPPP